MKMQQRHGFALAAGLVAAAVFIALRPTPGQKEAVPPPGRHRTENASARTQAHRQGNAAPAADVRPVLASALATDSPLATEKRADLLRRFAASPSPAEADLLLEFLASRCPPKMPLGSFALLFNEAANLLERQQDDALLSPYGKVLATVARDTGKPEILRDYAIQHLRVVWAKSAGIPPLRASVEDTFWSMSSGSGHPAAASLLSLHLLGTPDFPPDPATPYAIATARITARTLELLGDPSAPSGTRMTAARIAGERGIRQARDPLLALARNPGQPVAARLAAVAAFARLATASDLPALRSLGASSPELHAAVTSASARITAGK